MGEYAASSESAPRQDQPPGKNDCGEEHDKLFADLEALSEKQIEVGLAVGVWNDQVRPLIQHYTEVPC
jgi:hypothetical protein